MAGNSNSGRKRTPKATLLLHGSYRKDRHGDRDPPKFDGEPEKPIDLTPEVSAVWDERVPQLIAARSVTAADAWSLRQMCEMWVLYRKSFEAAMVSPLDKDIRIAVTAYKAAFEATASRFGLTPVDREKITKLPSDKDTGVRRRDRA